MKIRPLRQADAPFLCSIFNDNIEYYEIFFDSCDSAEEWEKRVRCFLNQNVVRHFVMEADGEKIGWLSYLDTAPAERELGILVVIRENLGRGYGAESLSWLIEQSRADGMRNLLLNVNQSNTRAIRFYQKFGFKIFGEEIIPQCNEAVNLAQYNMKLSLLEAST